MIYWFHCINLNERRINDCKIMFAPRILTTIETSLLNLRCLTLLQQCMLLLCLNTYTCLLLKPPILCFVIFMDMYYFSNTYGTVLAGRLCIILFSTWRYCVHTTCTQSGRSCSILRVNHVSLFLLMKTYVIYIYIYMRSI
jgi:hypothetical protein